MSSGSKKYAGVNTGREKGLVPYSGAVGAAIARKAARNRPAFQFDNPNAPNFSPF